MKTSEIIKDSFNKGAKLACFFEYYNGLVRYEDAYISEPDDDVSWTYIEYTSVLYSDVINGVDGKPFDLKNSCLSDIDSIVEEGYFVTDLINMISKRYDNEGYDYISYQADSPSKALNLFLELQKKGIDKAVFLIQPDKKDSEEEYTGYTIDEKVIVGTLSEVMNTPGIECGTIDLND